MPTHTQRRKTWSAESIIQQHNRTTPTTTRPQTAQSGSNAVDDFYGNQPHITGRSETSQNFDPFHISAIYAPWLGKCVRKDWPKKGAFSMKCFTEKCNVKSFNGKILCPANHCIFYFDASCEICSYIKTMIPNWRWPLRFNQLFARRCWIMLEETKTRILDHSRDLVTLINTTSAASTATSVPVPMAIPTWDWASAGESFTPSPTMATMNFFSWRERTFSTLCEGRTSANTCSIPTYRENTIQIHLRW